MFKNLKIFSIVSLLLGLLGLADIYSISSTLVEPVRLYLPKAERERKKVKVNENLQTDEYFYETDLSLSQLLKGTDKKAKVTFDTITYKPTKSPKPWDVEITNQNFEIFNKSNGPITFALQYSDKGPGGRSFLGEPYVERVLKGKASKNIETAQGDANFLENISQLYHRDQGQDNPKILLPTERQILLPTEHLCLYIYKGEFEIQTERDVMVGKGDAQNPNRIVSDPYRVYEFKIPVLKNSKGNPITTIYLTWDDKANKKTYSTGLKPETGQLGKILGIETGLAFKTESGLSIITNLDQANIIDITQKVKKELGNDAVAPKPYVRKKKKTE